MPVGARRIAVEAVRNVARHSSARRACVVLAVAPGELRMTVTDDGGQDGRSWRPGVGRCTAGPTRDGGRVEAALPLGTPPTPG
jgi:anti-sigma regulatory factor (Ser/Thr protein kinase)